MFPAEVLAVGGEQGLMRTTEAGSAVFMPGLRDVEQAGEHEVADLLDDSDGIGDATGVELQPEGVDFGFEAGCYHEKGRGEEPLMDTDGLNVSSRERYCRSNPKRPEEGVLFVAGSRGDGKHSDSRPGSALREPTLPSPFQA